MSLPMMASSMDSHSVILAGLGYLSLHTCAKCWPVTTPNLADSNCVCMCVGGFP